MVRLSLCAKWSFGETRYQEVDSAVGETDTLFKIQLRVRDRIQSSVCLYETGVAI